MNMRALPAYMDISAAVVFIAVSLPLILEQVPPNKWYGVRIPKAFASSENWYRINAYGGRALALWSTLLLALGFLKFVAPPGRLDAPWAQIWNYGPLLATAAVALIDTLCYARKL